MVTGCSLRIQISKCVLVWVRDGKSLCSCSAAGAVAGPGRPVGEGEDSVRRRQPCARRHRQGQTDLGHSHLVVGSSLLHALPTHMSRLPV